MNPKQLEQELLKAETRRHFFRSSGLGIGSVALASLLGNVTAQAGPATNRRDPLAPRPTHFPAKAKNVIFLFMAGGPSQLEMFDDKPKLRELSGKTVPPSYVQGKRFAFLKKDAPLLGSERKFGRYGNSGAEMSEMLPHLQTVADDIAIIKSMKTEVFNHGPAKLFTNTGAPQFMGRPSMGAWVTYGIGSEADDLPGFVVLQSGPRGPRGGSAHWSSGFLPTTFQGVPFLPGPQPILHLQNPRGISRRQQGEFIETLGKMNQQRLAQVGDPEIETRIASYEMAYRMQSSAPELIDLSGETKQTMEMYGATPGKNTFANGCLLARRLVERGVRFVQLYHTDWDDHGSLGAGLTNRCKEIDRPCTALIKDLKARGMLDDTLVIWGGEFGRTPMGESRDGKMGRDHHIDGYSLWLSGGGIKTGQTIGATDELGFYATEDPVHVHDLQATILHLLGIDHLKLTYRFQGRDFRLTDVGGHVVKKLLA